jgi:hypothetical protein
MVQTRFTRPLDRGHEIPSDRDLVGWSVTDSVGTMEITRRSVARIPMV